MAIFLLLPVMHINHNEKSDTENRALATRPNIIINGKINNKYGTEYDNWFSDRFFGRDILIKLYGTKSGNKDSAKVLVEKDNWLFYKSENSLRNFANMDTLSNEQLQNTATYLSQIKNWCEKHNKKFLVVIAPDKNKIYGEHITKIIKKNPDSQSRAIQLTNYLKSNTDVNVIYLYDQMIANKKNGLLYMKNDTHWNDFGAYIGYTEIMKALKLEPIKYKTETLKTNPHGDLTNMAPGVPLDNETIYKFPDFPDNAVCNHDFSSTEDIICTNKKYTISKRMFTLRDSFSVALGRYYANTFQKIHYRSGYGLSSKDLDYIKNDFDIVILEIVERNIHSLSHHKFPKD